MAYVEVRKNGKLVGRRRVEDEPTRDGCTVRLEGVGEARLAVGQSTTVGDYEITVTDDATASQEVLRSADFTHGPTITFDVAGLPDSGGREPAFPEVEGYEVTGRLGEGGMGVVWRAVQLSTRREVALKLLAAGRFHSDRARGRFEREVELSARLEHPNIARVYDSGLHRDVYYYAMELIDGAPLDAYVEATGPPLRKVLELMAQVSRAVQHAHQRGVIHRDLKPSNILVTPTGRPHVVDFGLAKTFLEADRGVTVSQDGDITGTPAYMSPEQAAGRIGEIDTRSDVYSLGVILYRLVVGRPPHDLGGSRLEVLRRIAEEDIRRPRELAGDIDGELEALLLKALAQDPAGRYAGAGELADDIDRYLAGDPLTARKPTTLYFLRKRLRKHRLPVAIAAGVLAVLAAMAVFSYVRVTDERDRAVLAEDDASQQRDVARQEARKATIAAENERLARRDAEEKQRRAEQEVYRYGIAEADRLSRAGMYTDARELLSTLDPTLRGWEYGHLMCRSKRRDFKELFTRKGHSGPVRSVAFSPDGKRLVSGSHDHSVKLWDTATGRGLLTLEGHSGQVRSVAFSPEGTRLASGSNDKTVKLWDTTTGGELFTLRGHSGWVLSVAFSPDGTRLASASGDKTIKLWDTVAGRELLTLEGHSDRVRAIAFSPDGRRLASGSWDKTIKLWDAATGGEPLTLKGRSGRVLAVAFSPDGTRLASGSWDDAIKLWDTATGGELLTLKGHSGRVLSVAFSPGGKCLASGGDDRSVKLWDTVTGRELLTLKAHSGAVPSVTFSPGGKRLASGGWDETVKLWDTATGRELLTLEGHSDAVWSVAFSPDGKRMASGSRDGTIKLWDTATGRGLLTFKGHSGGVWSVAFSPDGTRLASGSNDKTIKLWDTATGRGLLTLEGHSAAVRSVAFSPDGKRLASGSWNKTIKLWDTATGRELLTLRGHSRGVLSVAFSPDSRRLASGSDDRSIKLWDTATGRELLTLKGHSDRVFSVAFSSDGKRLASGSQDNTIKLWDAAAQERQGPPRSRQQATQPATRPGEAHGSATAPAGAAGT